MRLALGLSYQGSAYHGWQSQLSGRTVQDALERALMQFVATDTRMAVSCAGRTDSGVHALGQVIHFDAPCVREMNSWVRGVNRYLPHDIALQWAREVPENFHARGVALARRYLFVLSDKAGRGAHGLGRISPLTRAVDIMPMQAAAQILVGEHDFSSFRAAECQALSPIKTLQILRIWREGSLVLFEFQANAFLHHMVRNIVGALVAVGQGRYPPEWLETLLLAQNRALAAPTAAADGLYFLGPIYEAKWGLPQTPAATLEMIFSS